MQFSKMFGTRLNLKPNHEQRYFRKSLKWLITVIWWNKQPDWQCPGMLDWTLDSGSKGCGFDSRQCLAHLSFSKTLYPHCCSPPRCINVCPVGCERYFLLDIACVLSWSGAWPKCSPGSWEGALWVQDWYWIQWLGVIIHCSKKHFEFEYYLILEKCYKRPSYYYCYYYIHNVSLISTSVWPTGSNIAKLTDSTYDASGQLTSPADKSNMVRAARGLLSAITRVLLLADKIIIKQISQSRNRVRNRKFLP